MARSPLVIRRRFSLACLLLSLCALAVGAAKVTAQESPPPAKPTDQHADSLGDPLPDAALLRLGTTRFRHPDNVAEMALSPDGGRLATLGERLILWDTSTGARRFTANIQELGVSLPAACYGMRAAVFTPDGRHLLTPGRFGEVLSWDIATGKHTTVRLSQGEETFDPDEQYSRALDISPDGKLLAVGGRRGASVCRRDGAVLYHLVNEPHETMSDQNRDRLLFGGDYTLVRFAPDGKTLAVVTNDAPNSVRIVESETGQAIRFIALKARLVRLAFSPNGERLVTTERDNAVRLYDVSTASELWTHEVQLRDPYETYTSAVEFSRDGQCVAVAATDNALRLLDGGSGEELVRMIGHFWYPWCLAFSPDGRMLYSSGWEGAIRRWDLQTGEQLPLPVGVRGTSVSAASPDGKLLAYRDDAGTIHLVDSTSGAERKQLRIGGDSYVRLTFSPDGTRLAAGGTNAGDMCVAVWELAASKPLHRWTWPKGKDPHSSIEDLAFSPCGDRLAAAVFRQSAGYLWNLTDGKQVASLKHPRIYGLSFGPDGATLVSAGWDSYIRFWSSETGSSNRTSVKVPKKHEHDESAIYTLRCAPQGNLLACVRLRGDIDVRRADTLQLLRSFESPGGLTEAVLDFSPDGLWLACVASGRIILRDPRTGDCVWSLGRHQGEVYQVGFVGDSRRLLSGGQDGVSYVWDLRPANAIEGSDPASLWTALATDNSQAAYDILWDPTAEPQRAIALLAGYLKAVRIVVDEDAAPVEPGQPAQEWKAWQIRLANGDPQLARAIVVRRAISWLAQRDMPEATDALRTLSRQQDCPDVSRLASAALKRKGDSAPPRN